MTTELNLSTEQEKYIALQQHLKNNFFTFEYDGSNYICEGYSKKYLEKEYSETVSIVLEELFYQWLVSSNSTKEIPDIEDDDCDYMVLTDSEADDMTDEHIENYIDDCVLPEIPESYRAYFNRDSFKYDCLQDGRGHTLSGYDGNEYEETVNLNSYYIYRCN